MAEKHYQFVQNRACEYFPCHSVADETTFNCLFCYCPLYALKDQCGGNFRYLDSGIKDCSECSIPHSSGGYDHVMSHIRRVLELGKREQSEA